MKNKTRGLECKSSCIVEHTFKKKNTFPPLRLAGMSSGSRKRTKRARDADDLEDGGANMGPRRMPRRPFDACVVLVHHPATGRFGHRVGEPRDNVCAVWFPCSSAANNVETLPTSDVAVLLEDVPAVPAAACAGSTASTQDYWLWHSSSCIPASFQCDPAVLYVGTARAVTLDALGGAALARIDAAGAALDAVLDAATPPVALPATPCGFMLRLCCADAAQLPVLASRVAAAHDTLWVSRAWRATAQPPHPPPSALSTRVCTVTLKSTRDDACAATCAAVCDMLPGLVQHRFGSPRSRAPAHIWADVLYDGDFHAQRTFLTWPVFAALVASRTSAPPHDFPEPLASYMAAVRAVSALRDGGAGSVPPPAFNAAPCATPPQRHHAATLFYWAVLHVDDATLPAPRAVLCRALELYLALGLVVLRKRAYVFKPSARGGAAMLHPQTFPSPPQVRPASPRPRGAAAVAEAAAGAAAKPAPSPRSAPRRRRSADTCTTASARARPATGRGAPPPPTSGPSVPPALAALLGETCAV